MNQPQPQILTPTRKQMSRDGDFGLGHMCVRGVGVNVRSSPHPPGTCAAYSGTRMRGGTLPATVTN